MKKQPVSVYFSLLAVIQLSACTPLIGPYDLVAYQNATSLKAETLALMDKATRPYSEYEQKADALLIEMDKAYEYVKGIPGNDLSAQQWYILKKPDGALMGKFLKRWKERSVLSSEYIANFKELMVQAFDEIICLEANKKEPTPCRKP